MNLAHACVYGVLFSMFSLVGCAADQDATTQANEADYTSRHTNVAELWCLQYEGRGADDVTAVVQVVRNGRTQLVTGSVYLRGSDSADTYFDGATVEQHGSDWTLTKGQDSVSVTDTTGEFTGTVNGQRFDRHTVCSTDGNAPLR